MLHKKEATQCYFQISLIMIGDSFVFVVDTCNGLPKFNETIREKIIETSSLTKKHLETR